MADIRSARLDLGELLAAVEDAPPVAAVDVLDDRLRKAIGAGRQCIARAAHAAAITGTRRACPRGVSTTVAAASWRPPAARPHTRRIFREHRLDGERVRRVAPSAIRRRPPQPTTGGTHGGPGKGRHGQGRGRQRPGVRDSGQGHRNTERAGRRGVRGRGPRHPRPRDPADVAAGRRAGRDLRQGAGAEARQGAGAPAGDEGRRGRQPWRLGQGGDRQGRRGDVRRGRHHRRRGQDHGQARRQGR